jgi:hypothetical protein
MPIPTHPPIGNVTPYFRGLVPYGTAAGKPLGRNAIEVEEDSIPCDFSITSVART